MLSKEKKPHLLGQNLEFWQDWVVSQGQPKYRAKQILNWLTAQGQHNPESFTNIPKALNEAIKSSFYIPEIRLDPQQDESGTAKFLIEADPGKVIETVWLPYEKRQSLCISIQAGCSLDCSFCATGKIKFNGNLTAGGILSQVNLVQNKMGKKVTNVVFMGMGEPFYNYENTMKAAEALNDSDQYNLGAKKITISTSGVLPGLEKFLAERRPFSLALSLHAAIPEKRASIMDIEKKYPLAKIIDLLGKQRSLLKANQLTFEYIMIKDFNMSKDDALSLAKLAKRVNARVNLIPLNTNFGGHQRPQQQEMDAFWKMLHNENVVAINRQSPGYDIKAACGMLAGQST